MLKLDFAAVSTLAAQSAAATVADCACNGDALAAWESFPASLDLKQFQTIGTLMDDPYDEPTFAEYHPDGTRYDSREAPIAPRYFPYNRCEVARCLHCGRCFLRYSEAGGYFNDPRIRALQPALLVDAPL